MNIALRVTSTGGPCKASAVLDHHTARRGAVNWEAVGGIAETLKSAAGVSPGVPNWISVNSSTELVTRTRRWVKEMED
jgi:hypothetical protein